MIELTLKTIVTALSVLIFLQIFGITIGMTRSPSGKSFISYFLFFTFIGVITFYYTLVLFPQIM